MLSSSPTQRQQGKAVLLRRPAERVIAALARVIGDPRLRSELGWVLINRLFEFITAFVLLKLLTNTLDQATFAQFSLTDTAIMLLTGVLLTPVKDPFLRDYYGAIHRGEGRGAGRLVLWWVTAVTVVVALASAVLSRPLSWLLGMSPWTIVAAGLVFVGSSWRFLGQDCLNTTRERRLWALHNIGYWLLQLGLIWLALSLFEVSAASALFAYALATLVFAVISIQPLLREIRRQPEHRGALALSQLIFSFGVPTAVLLGMQWFQGFADRYLLEGLMDSKIVGQYVASYQVCGVPYQFLVRFFVSLLSPIAYQRGHDLEDAHGIWAADRVLLAGTGVLTVVGLAMLGIYWLFGRELVALLTSPGYVLGAGTLTLMAAGRFVQALGLSLQPLFAVHHRMRQMLGFRVFGALLTLPLCWWGIRYAGVAGAALGSLLASVLYTLGLLVAPGGCAWLVIEVRRRARGSR